MAVLGPERTLLNAILGQDVDAAQAGCAKHGTDIVVMLLAAGAKRMAARTGCGRPPS
jgi:hypothetical protein